MAGESECATGQPMIPVTRVAPEITSARLGEIRL